MILQIQPVHGKGTSRNLKGGLNFVGVSIATRFLYSVMTARVYSGKHGARLDRLVEYMAQDLADLFHSPVEVNVGGHRKWLYFSCIALKGDWPALVKLGKLERHFGHNGAGNSGICHLCKAGQESHNYADFSYEAMLKAREDVPPPWVAVGGLTKYVPQDQSRLPEFYRIDIFHTFHKGVFGDLAANAIETRSLLGVIFSLSFPNFLGIYILQSWCWTHFFFVCPSQVSLFDFKIGGMTKGKSKNAVFEEVKEHARSNRLQLHMTALTDILLGIQSSWKFPTCGWFKGDDTRTLLHYLENRYETLVVAQVEPAEYLSTILETIKGANHFMHVIYNAGLWLTSRERGQAIAGLRRFLRNYRRSATMAFEKNLPRFRLSPKFHTAAEIFFELLHAEKRSIDSLNSLTFSTQIDEDFVGRVATYSRSVSSRTVHFKTVQRYKLGLAVHWK